MRILLISPIVYYKRVLPLGIVYLSSYLKRQGYKISIYYPTPKSNRTLAQELITFKPDYIGFSCTTAQYQAALEMLDEVKRYNIRIKAVFGGIHPSACKEEVIRNKEVDYVIYGEGEETFKELLEGKELESIDGLVWKNKGKIIINKPRKLIEDLDSLPMPNFDAFNMDWFTQRETNIRGLYVKNIQLMSSRGCPFNCTFCASGLTLGKRFRTHSPERVVNEMEYVWKKYNIEMIVFHDDTFTIDKNRVYNICNLLLDKRLNIKWHVQARVDTLNEDLLRKMKDAGCVSISFGIESGCQRILDRLQKGTTIGKIKEISTLCKKIGIRTINNFMLGTPTETYEEMLQTLKLAKELKGNYTEFFVTTPYPGTKLYEECRKEGKLLDKSKIVYACYRHGWEGTSLIQSEKDIDKIRRRFKRRFLFRNLKPLIFNYVFLRDMIKPGIIKDGIKELMKTKSLDRTIRLINVIQRNDTNKKA